MPLPPKKNLQRRLLRLKSRIQATQNSLEKLYSWRLGLGLVLFVNLLIISALSSNRWPFLLSFAVLSVLFHRLIRSTAETKNHLQSLTQWSQFLVRQDEKAQGSYAATTPHDPTALSEDKQHLVKDLDLFGAQSVFSILSEAFSPQGREVLSDWLLSPLESKEEILERQTQIKSLWPLRWPLTRWTLVGHKSFETAHSLPLISKLSLSQLCFLDDKGKQRLLWSTIVFVVTWALVILALTETIGIHPALPVIVFAFFSLGWAQGPSENFGRAQDLALQIKNYLPLFQFVEAHPQLKEITPIVSSEKPSIALRKIHRLIDLLSLRAHPLVHLVVNALFPWDLCFSFFLQKWLEKHRNHFHKWSNELAQLEALSSLFYTYQYQTQTFPGFADQAIKTSDIFHPLIPRQHNVANDFSCKKEQLVLITGSNMSGKSTFLRTIGVNQTLAMMGAPVFANSMTTHMAPVETCLRISDSLEHGVSSFYFEVKRVRTMIERARTGDTFIYLIDEIFRGTNNRERLHGSRSVIREFLKHPSAFGMISTHDLELAQLAETYPNIRNSHFSDDITTDRSGLSFSYKIQEGPCPSTNALKIMAAEGLPVS